MENRIRLLIGLMAFVVTSFSLLAQDTLPCTDLYISEYLDGGDMMSKALEIYNSSDTMIQLSEYAVEIYPDGSTSPSTISLNGKLYPKQVFVLAHPQSDPAVLAISDTIHSSVLFDGNDAIALRKGPSTQNDIIGVIGVDPGPSGWVVPPLGSTDNVCLKRKYNVTRGSTDWSIAQNQYEVYSNTIITDLGIHNSVCICNFPQSPMMSWWLGPQLDVWDIQQDVYVFRLYSGLPYSGYIDSMIVDSLVYVASTNMEFNVVYFDTLATTIQKTTFIDSLRNNSDFKFEFPVITRFDSLNRTKEEYFFSSSMIKVVFQSTSPSISDIQTILSKYDLNQLHTPDSALPTPANGSWTYYFTINPSVCHENAPTIARRMAEEDSAIVKYAEPWIEPVANGGTGKRSPLTINSLPESATTNDTYYSKLWHVNNIGQCIETSTSNCVTGIIDADCEIELAWNNYGVSGQGIRVAVIDKSLYDSNHPDISPKYVDGYDYIDGDNDVTMSSGPTGKTDHHGQLCAGIIGAIGNNNIGTIGVAYGAEIIPMICYYDAIESALQDAIIKEVDIISMSFAIENFSSMTIESELNNCKQVGRFGKGIVSFAAVGQHDDHPINDNRPDNFPARLPSVIAVIGTDPEDHRLVRGGGGSCEWQKYTCNFGPFYDLAAPGTNIISTDLLGPSGYLVTDNPCDQNFLNTGYSWFHGSSAATPIAAGVAALILEADTSLMASQVQSIMRLAADIRTTSGVAHYRIDACQALSSISGGYCVPISTESPIEPFSNIILFPNPAHDQIQLEFISTNAKDYEVFLLDIFGRDIAPLGQGSTVPGERQSLTLSLPELPKGVYLLRIATKESSQLFKFLRH